ncbi:MAG: hypothetical protein U9R42_02000 [Bacteroidota bacterium]|nr:hypothetical protein [Bacteroidota bacterium]
MKEKININNYEIFFIDYLEGNLSEEEIKDVGNFLNENPDLKNEFEGIENATVTPNKVSMPEKDSLFKKENDLIPNKFESEEEFFVAKVEGDLNIEEESKFNRFVAVNPKREKELLLYKNAKLKADKNIIFKEKASLKRFSIVTTRTVFLKYLVPIAVAATIAVMFIFINEDTVKKQNTGLSESNTAVIEKSNKNTVINNKNNLVEKTIETKTIKLQEKPKTESIAQRTTVFVKNENIKKEKRSDFKNKITNNKIAKADIGVKPDNLKFEKAKDDFIEGELLQNEMTETVYNAWVDEVEPKRISQKNKTAKSYTVKKYLEKRFREKYLSEESNDNRKLGFWDIAGAGLTNAGGFFGKDIKLKKQYNDEGKVNSLAFHSPKVDFALPIRK